MSDSNRVALRYVPEVTYNQTPTDSANWQALRFTSEAISGETQTAESQEIRTDRMISDMPKVGTQIGGTLGVEISPTTYDDFLEAVMGGAWTADELKVGVNDYSFSIEKEFEDISGDRYINFTGMRVGQFSMTLEYGSLATGEFTFGGAGEAVGASSAVGAGSVAAPTTTPVLNNSANITGVKIDGLASTECLRSLSLTINGGLRPKECLGNDAPIDQTKGSLKVTGEVSIYLESLALEQKKINNTDFSLEFTLSRGGAGYTFFFPKMKIGGPTPGSSGLDQDVFLEGSFSALADETEESSLVITRF